MKVNKIAKLIDERLDEMGALIQHQWSTQKARI